MYNISLAIINHLKDTFEFKLFRNFYKFWGELHMLTDKEEIKVLKEQYNKVFLEVGWRSIWGFGELVWIFQTFILLFSFDFKYMKLAIFPLSAMSMLLIIDQVIYLNKSRIENMFFCLSLLQGIIITHEGLHYSEYKFHETWLVYYMTYLLTGIATWFRWK